MAQNVSVGYHALDTSQLQNERFSKVIAAGVYSGYYVLPNAGTPNLLDLSVGSDGSSVLLTSEGVRVEETTNVLAAVAIEAADSALTRVDLVVCEYQYTTDPNVKAVYKVIKGKNQVSLTLDPVDPEPQSDFQVPIAYVTVRPQTTSSGLSTASIDQTDIRTVPKARWSETPEGLSGLKPEILPIDTRRIYVYPGVFPSVDGKRAVTFSGAYSDPLSATNLSDGSTKFYLFGLNDSGTVSLIGSADSEDELPDLTVDIIPIAIVLGRVVNAQVQLSNLQDIRFPFFRRLADPNEEDYYTDLLSSSVFKYLRVERFVDSSGVDLESVQLESGSSDSLTASLETSDTSLQLVWDTSVTSTPGESATFVTADLLNGSSIQSVTHFQVSASATSENIQFQYSTSSANAGFTTDKYSTNEIIRVPLQGARKLYLKFFIPSDAFISGTAKVFNFGVLINLESSVTNTVSVSELGLSELSKSVTNLIANGSFYYWSQDDTSGNNPDLTNQNSLTFSLSEDGDRVLLADGWQITSFPVPAVGEVVERLVIDDIDGANTALRYKGASDLENSGAATIAEYRIPRAAELSGQHLTYAIEYTTSAAASLGIGIAQYTRTSSGLVLKTKDEAYTNSTEGELYVYTTTTIGDDVDQVSFYLIFLEIGSDTEHVIRKARAAVGTYFSLPYTSVPSAPAILRQYYERGRVFSAASATEGDQVGGSSQFGTRKSIELGELVIRTTEASDSNRSINVGDISYSGDAHSLVALTSSSSSGLASVDVDWEAFVKYSGSIQ